MRLLNFKTIRGHLTYWFLLLSLTPLIIALLITYYRQVQVIETTTYNKLIAIRDLKVQQVNNWLEERAGDLNLLAGNYEVRSLEEVLQKNIKSTKDLEKIEAAHELFVHALRNYKAYKEIFFINANTGLIEISTNAESLKINKSGDEFFKKPLETGEIYIKNIYNSPTTGEPEMTFSIPVYCMPHNTDIIGVIVTKINLGNSLYQLLSNRIGLGETGETLIVNRNAVALNDLHWYDDAPLKLQITAEPAVYASRGQTGIIATKDYRDVKVLAAYTYIPQIEWGFVAKQDMKELNIPIRKMMWDFTILFLVSGSIIIILALFISKTISKPIVAINKVAQKIGAGNFSVRNKIISRDELGSLALEFNKMADITESKIKVQQDISDISETMIGKTNMKGFSNSLLKHLMKITNANMGTFYILNDTTSEYEPFASIGANQEMLEPFNADNPQGEFGNVLSTKKIFHLKNIPSDTIFKFKTVAGEALPKEIITIPIFVEETVVAIISLVNIEPFSPNINEILQHSWFSINTFYSNLITSERTRILAEHLSRINQQLEVQSEELQDQAEELQNQAEELRQNSEELQEQNIELENQRKQVETASKLKSEFLSNMSHELRTPLNSIMALSRVLIMQAKEKLNEEERSYLEIVERNGKHLLSLINDILDLSKIEAGKMEVMPKFISIGPFLQIVKENIQSLAEKKGLSLTLSLPENLPQVQTDESRLHQVMLNILGNAVKFTEKGSVDIFVDQDSTNIFIHVKDTGIGIPENMMPYIFDEFRQVDGGASRQYEGTGLGLAIAKKLANILGGNISVNSKLGKGSEFIVRIPIKWEQENLLLTDLTKKTEIKTPQLTKDTILVVDDDPKAVKSISEYLKEAGYNTITAKSGKDALKLAENYQPFAITLDIIMPEMDGWEVLQKLKEKQATKNIPVILVSVSDEQDTGFALGAAGFINKPVQKEELLNKIKEINILPDTVMIVDDNETELNLLSEIIEAENIKTIKASRGYQCIELLGNSIPDILLLDLMLPDIDGFAVLDKIRKNPKTQNLPVIIITAKDLTKKEKLSGNISSLIAKSNLSPEYLLSEIKRIIREVEKNREDNNSREKNSKTRILMVEDNPDAIIQVKSVLEKRNYEVDIARGGQEALDYIKFTIPDGIILDLMMPGIDGFEVLEKIRSSKRTQKIPVLILTAKDLTSNDLAKLSANNIQQLIHKGDVDIDGLLSKVSLMLKNISLFGNSVTHMPNILVVEDNPDNMTTLKAILKGRCHIEEATNGEDGLALAQSSNPDIILLDMSLPKIGGQKIIEILKKNENTSHIPVIAVTALAMKGDREKILMSGCDGYVSKPIDHVQLNAEIEKLLKK